MKKVRYRHESNETKRNSLTSLSNTLAGNYPWQAPLQNINQTYYNSRMSLITLRRGELNDRYATDSVIKTVVDQPIDDALKGNIEIQTAQLDDAQKEELNSYILQNRIIDKIKELFKWNRLFGGAAMLIDVDSIPLDQPMYLEDIPQGSNILFVPADRWELTNTPFTYNPLKTAQVMAAEAFSTQFDYYGSTINNSHSIILTGKEAPSLIRPRLMGWGLSVVEPLVAPLNAFDQTKNVIYELVSEAKIDVWKIKDLNSTVGTAEGTQATTDYVKLTQMIKNALKALVMDSEDDFVQRQLNLSGCPAIMDQGRIDICGSSHIPITKLFGLSPSGFNTGEADIENYNSWVESEVRNEIRTVLFKVVKIICQSLFGTYPEDLDFVFEPLRTLKMEEVQMANERKFKMALALYQNQLMTSQELAQFLKEQDILSMETKALKGELPEFTQAPSFPDETKTELEL